MLAALALHYIAEIYSLFHKINVTLIMHVAYITTVCVILRLRAR